MKIPLVKVEIKPSKIVKGEVGLFSVRDLEKNSILFIKNNFKDHFVNWKNNSKDFVTKNKIYGFCLGNKKGFWAPEDFNNLPISWYMNHSCDPNVGFNKKGDFILIKNIKKGEELCWDYGFAETNPKFELKCLCKKNNCRKIVTGFDYYNKNIFGDNFIYRISEKMIL